MIGEANKVKLSFIDEVTAGTTPATPAMQDLRYMNESLTYNDTTVESEEIRDDRNVVDLIQTSRSVSGAINGEMSGLTYDKILRNGFMSDADWTTLAMTESTIASTVSGFTDSGTGFITEGIEAGQTIEVDGFTDALNNRFYEVLTVAAGVITTYPAPNSVEAAGDPVTISGSTIKTGVTDRPMTIQKQLTGITTPVYQNFRGCRVSKLRFGMTSEAKITFGFDVMGMSAENTVSQIAGRTEVAKTTTRILTSSVNAFELLAKSSGLTTVLKFTEISLDFDNMLRELKAVGTRGAVDVRAGTIAAVATINPYFEDIQVLQAFEDNDEFSLSWRLTSGDGYTYVFSMPQCKFKTQTLAAGGRNTDLIVNATCQALLHPTYGYTMRIDRFTTV